jgi:acyl-coenzyme A synthetase/AMP-(fatty) acid ligase
MMSIRARLADAPDRSLRSFWCGTATVCFDDLLQGTCLGGRLVELSDKSVLIATRDQLAAALVLIELDGIARRIVICPPDLPTAYFPGVVITAGVDAIVSDHVLSDESCRGVSLRVVCDVSINRDKRRLRDQRPTEWVLLTSGTTGFPRLIAHTLTSLTAAIHSDRRHNGDAIWGTFYDIRRYGGLQILLRALLGPRSLVLAGPDDDSPESFLSKLAAHNVTHLSGTPSHWRKVLMHPAAHVIAPRYIRLSGEIADQSILNALCSVYPQATIVHAYASTEAGVGFEVGDGQEGFPVSLIGRPGPDIKIDHGTLRIRSAGNAIGCVGDRTRIADRDGFIDTGDTVERRGDRYYFRGRRGGIINIGGLKVFPEEVEAVINRHPAVCASVVRARNSSITGSLVAADIVLNRGLGDTEEPGDIRREILQMCRERLARHKVPTAICFVSAIDVTPTGKLARHHA